MTLAELRNQAMLEGGILVQSSAPEQVAEIDRLLNHVQRIYGSRWLVPRLLENQVGFTAASLTLPRVPYADGIIEVLVDDGNRSRKIPILRREEAEREYPNRANLANGIPEFVVYDVVNPSVIDFFPTPSSAIDVRIYYAAPPNPMEVHTDEPWDGQFSEYHYVIAKRAALHIAANRIGNFNKEDAPVNTYTLLRGELREAEADIDASLLSFGLVRYNDWWGLGQL